VKSLRRMSFEQPADALETDRPDEAFRDAMRRFATTVSIISCSDDQGRPHGMSATAVTSVCANPPTLLVCINKTSATNRAVSGSARFCVNVLRSYHAELSRVFSGKFRGDERFRLGNWDRSADGLIFLRDAQANLFCRVHKSLDYETHTLFFGRVYAVRTVRTVDPLLYQDGRYSLAGPVPDGDASDAAAWSVLAGFAGE
jgi:flavin reductase